ncbi:MAG: succinylglutamate desuccinylase/aspartoacylase family protein [Alphaproteobacteria bacterium]|nr:succinylglutamate desuccinylase/aspartoacylase family protein [Alphaproteobacteria bacterium]
MDSVSPDLDLSRDGRQTGFLRIPGATPVPVISIRNGTGPCVVLVSGCHGDEFVGPVALMRFVRQLDPHLIQGQLIVLAAANAPAVEAGARRSPLDNANLDRAFLGQPRGAPTAAIADWIERVLLNRATLVVDLHSGGETVEYVPSTTIYRPKNDERRASLWQLVQAFGLPIAFIVDERDDSPASLNGACERLGVSYLAAELGGGGTVSIGALSAALAAINRLLQSLGLLAEAACDEPPPVRLLRRLADQETIVAPDRGLFEPCVAPGADVAQGALAGRIHDPLAPWASPIDVSFPLAGTVLCRRVRARVERGDRLFKLGVSFAGMP